MLALSRDLDRGRVQQVLQDGLLPQELFRNGHVMKMYRWREFEELLNRHPCELLVASACNFLTTGIRVPALEVVTTESALTDLLDWELRCRREEGALNCGTHFLSIVQQK